jgi:hypothetical protein
VAVISLAAASAKAQDVNVTGDLSAANAQAPSNFNRDRNISVTQRAHPEYEALGIHLGGFMLYPKLTTNAQYNDNIFAAEQPTADAVFQIAPSFSLNSNWSRHALNFYANGVLNRFAQNSNQDTDNYSVGGNGRLDVLRSAQVTAGFDVSRLTEARTSAGSQGNEFPVQYRQDTVYIAGDREFNRLKLSGRFDWQKYDYFDRPGNTPQDDRNHSVMTETVRGDYALSPDTALFVSIAHNSRNYELSSSPVIDGVPEFPDFVDRDSNGYEVLAGANFELAALIRGEIAVGYLDQKYHAAGLQDTSGLGARGQVEWFPSQLTTVTLTGTRTVEDSAVIGSSGYLSTNLNAQVDHELLRNLILSANVGYGNDTYKEIDRDDRRYTAGFSATYLMNRRIGLKFSYSYFNQDSTGVNVLPQFRKFNVNVVGLGVTLQY